MRNICFQVLVSVTLIPLFSYSCASIDVSAQKDSFIKDGRIVLDIDRSVAYINGVKTTAIDCSNEQFYCVSLPSIADLVVARSCRDGQSSIVWTTPVGVLRFDRQMVHIGAPYGSYVTEKYYKTVLYYIPERGFHEIREYNFSPFDQRFDYSDYIRKYEISSIDGGPLFLCS